MMMMMVIVTILKRMSEQIFHADSVVISHAYLRSATEEGLRDLAKHAGISFDGCDTIGSMIARIMSSADHR